MTAELAPPAPAPRPAATHWRARARRREALRVGTSVMENPPGCARFESAPCCSARLWTRALRPINRRQRACAMHALTAAARAKTRIRLLAGISTISTSARPTPAATRSSSSTSRTPHSGLPSRRLVSNTALLTAVCCAAALERSVDEQPAVRPQIARRACDQPFGHRPWRDVDDIGAEHREQRPGPAAVVHLRDTSAGSDRSIRMRRADIGRAAHMRARRRCSSDAASLRSLGHQVMSGVRRGEVDDMLAGAAADFDHVAGLAGAGTAQARPRSPDDCDETPPRRAGRRARSGRRPCRIRPHIPPRRILARLNPSDRLNSIGITGKRMASFDNDWLDFSRTGGSIVTSR